MSILKYKYEAHKFINVLFYLIVFVVGFVIGLGVKKIDVSKIVNQFLMIESVSAYEISGIVEYEDTSLDITSSNFDSEEYIYKIFNYVTETAEIDIKFSDFINVFALNYEKSSSTSYYLFSTSEWYDYVDSPNNKHAYTNGDIFSIEYYPLLYGKKKFKYRYYINENNERTDSYVSVGSGFYIFSTQDFTGSDGFYKVLDFSEYSINLEFNENLFKNNDEFKEVCVDSNKIFAITSTTLTDEYDFIWFPYGLDKLNKTLYDNNAEHSLITYEEEEAFLQYWFNSKEKIEEYFSADVPGKELKARGYLNKYSYYGWSAHPFKMYFSENNNQFTIFVFDNPSKLYVGSSGIIHSGGGTRLEFDEEIEDNSYCFYIRKEFVVQYIESDEFYDFYGEVETPFGNIEFFTSYKKDKMSSNGLMSQVLGFISTIKDTLNFVRKQIYYFYLSLPLLVRMFLISLFVILIIKFIIGMVVR